MMADIHKIMYNIHKVQLPETCSVYRKDVYDHNVLHALNNTHTNQVQTIESVIIHTLWNFLCFLNQWC